MYVFINRFKLLLIKLIKLLFRASEMFLYSLQEYISEDQLQKAKESKTRRLMALKEKYLVSEDHASIAKLFR